MDRKRENRLHTYELMKREFSFEELVLMTTGICSVLHRPEDDDGFVRNDDNYRRNIGDVSLSETFVFGGTIAEEFGQWFEELF